MSISVTFLTSFMEVTGSVEKGYDSVASSAQTKEDFERIFKRREGSSGFMRFMTVDHGGWLAEFLSVLLSSRSPRRTTQNGRG
jgi:hypothetical protein